MTTHDVLAYSVATEAVRRIRAAAEPWRSIFSANTYVTASRSWPIPDFVIADVDNDLTVTMNLRVMSSRCSYRNPTTPSYQELWQDAFATENLQALQAGRSQGRLLARGHLDHMLGQHLQGIA